MVWVSDREPGVRDLFRELLPEAEILTPEDFVARSALGQRPDALVIDGTQLMELPTRLRSAILKLPRVLICTGMLLASMPMRLVRGPNVAVLAKPFSMDDLDAALEWLRGTRSTSRSTSGQTEPVLQRPRAGGPGRTLPIG
jgi:hypothetical protein